MYKLALVGKDISHSKSQKMYEELLSEKVNYTLLDYSSAKDIPSAIELFKEFDGISITAPYKKHFLAETIVDSNCVDLMAVNCLRLKDNVIESTNTDFSAVEEHLSTYNKFKTMKVIILGNGSMSFMTQKVLKQKNIEFEVVARKTHGDISKLNLNEFFSNSSEKKLIINSCSRSFIFEGDLPSDAIFWDYNYNYEPHASLLADRCFEYIDGLEMLKSQAYHALKFWGIAPD